MTAQPNPLEAVERLSVLIEQRIGQDFDGECHLTEAEARQVISTLRSQAEALERLEALRPVLAEYDALLATCPLSSRNPVIRASARDICPVCRNGPDGACGRDNPWQLVEATRAALTPEVKP